jgi:sulfite exporter TauE/SafE
VLVASLAGSLHCVGMCGGLVLASTQSRWEIAQYHLGRLLAYLGLGALAGGLGQVVFRSEPVVRSLTWVSWLSTFALAFGFFVMGIQLWRGRSPSLIRIPQAQLNQVYRIVRGRAFFSGAASGLLPCGWLHAFVLSAAATQSVLLGAALMGVFWVGTLPALTFAPGVIQKVLGPLARRSPRIAGTVLIFTAFLSLGLKFGHHHHSGPPPSSVVRGESDGASKGVLPESNHHHSSH